MIQNYNFTSCFVLVQKLVLRKIFIAQGEKAVRWL